MRVIATCGLLIALVTTTAGLPRPEEGKFEWVVNRVRNAASYMHLVDFPACPENSDLPCREDGINIARWCDRSRGASLHRAGPFSNPQHCFQTYYKDNLKCMEGRWPDYFSNNMRLYLPNPTTKDCQRFYLEQEWDPQNPECLPAPPGGYRTAEDPSIRAAEYRKTMPQKQDGLQKPQQKQGLVAFQY